MPASVAYLFDRITVNPRQCGGRPWIQGMRIRVIDLPRSDLEIPTEIL